MTALLHERVGALVHPVSLVRAHVLEAHVDALAPQARQAERVLRTRGLGEDLAQGAVPLAGFLI